MTAQVSITLLKNQANSALSEAQKIKQTANYRAIGQSRGFFGKKDIFEYEVKKGEFITTILKGYSKEREINAYVVAEE